jgi:rod shape-determining protein MreC
LLDFLRRNRVLLASAFCLLVAAALVGRTSRERTRADALGRFFLEVMAPLERGTAAVRRAVAASWQDLLGLVRARDENAVLRARVRQLMQELDALAEFELENARLRKLVAFRATVPGDLLAARVVGRDATGRGRTLTIDRGERAGVTKGAAVLAPEGVVGQVFLVSRNAARVLLVSDHNSGVDALVRRSRARGILQGTVDAGCVLKYVNRIEDVQVGDVVITSGLDGIFPKGLPVGEVVSVDRGGRGLFQHAEIAPRVDFSQLEEVLVTRSAAEPDETPAGAAGR